MKNQFINLEKRTAVRESRLDLSEEFKVFFIF